jgi:quercetin dioxygenase-like cupin family protein
LDDIVAARERFSPGSDRPGTQGASDQPAYRIATAARMIAASPIPRKNLLMKRRAIVIAAVTVLALVPAVLLLALMGGARWLAVSLSEDPGISWMVLTDSPDYRVLRDFAQSGATRRMHHHADASWHILTLTTGKLTLTVEGEPPVEVSPGQPVTLKGGVMHSFTNSGTELATLVEVFGKAKSGNQP